MKGHIFVCKLCGLQATDEYIEVMLVGPLEKKKQVITVFCPNCKTHTHYLLKK